MDFLEKIFSNANQEPKEEERFSHLIKRILSGNSSEINPNYLYELQSHCQTRENANKVMNALSHALDEFCDSPLPVFKALKLILLLLKLSAQTFTPAARNYLPEIQTIVHVSFDKPAAPHVNTIHRYANIIYLHLVKNIPLPEMKIPPRPKQNNPQPQLPPQNQSQRQPQRPGRSRIDNTNNDEGSLFDSNDNNKYEESGSFLSGFLDLGPKRPQQQQKQQQAQQPSKRSQNQEGPRLPAVFASGGAFQGIQSRISQPLDYGYEDENMVGEEAGGSLLNFNDASTSGQSNDLVGAFDDIGNEPKSNNTNNSIDQTDFVFSGAEPVSSNQQNTDINAPFNPFGADGFNPTFPDFDDHEKNDTNKPSNTYRKPFVASGPKPKFDPSKMKKKPKIVPNTVPQDNFDPFGTGSATNAFDNIPKDNQAPPKKLSLAERLGQKPEPQKHEEQPKKPQQPSKNVFDLLGIPGSESDDGNEPETQTNSTTEKNSSQNQPQKGSSNVFDVLGDDFGSFEAPPEEKPKVTSNEEPFEPFGSSSQLQQQIDQVQQKNTSANVFDMLDDNSFTTPSIDQKQPSQPASNNELFADFNSLDQTKPEQNKEQPQKNTSANVFDMLDDNSFSTPPNSTSNIASNQQQKDEPFEPFGSSIQKNQDKANDKLFEPFGSSSQQQQQKQPQTESKDDLFEPFSSTTQQQQQPQKQQTKSDDLFESFEPSSQQQETKNDDLFEPFSSSPQQQQKQPQTGSKDDLFEPIDSTNTEQQQPQKQQTKSDDLFEIINHSNQQQQQQSSGNDNMFEPIGSSNQQQQPQKSSGNVFDMLDGDDFNAPQASNQSSQLQTKSSANNELFNTFEPVKQTAPTQKQNQPPKNSSANVFDMLDDSFPPSPSLPPKTQPETPKSDLFESFNSPSQQNPQTNSNNDIFESFGSSKQQFQQTNSKNELFEPFEPSTTPTQQKQQVQQTNSKNDIFEPFGSSTTPTQQKQQTNSKNDLFEPFESTTQQIQQTNSKNDLFEPFESTTQPVQQTNSKNDLFEPFGSSTTPQQPKQQQQTNSNNNLFEPFGSSTTQPQKSSGNVFDMLDGNNFNTPQVSNKNSAADDLFETFASAPTTATAPQNPPQFNKQPKNASANVFDMLGDDVFSSNPAPVASNDGNGGLFDSFVSVPASGTQQNSSNAFDLLDSTNNNQQSNSTPKKSNNPYDIFG